MDRSANTKHSLIVEFFRRVLITALLLAGLAQMASAAEPDFGEVKVLAQVPQPGFPEGVVRRGLLTRIAAELPDRMPDFGLITLQGEPPGTAVLAFMDVIRNMADHKAEAALADRATPGTRPKPRGRASSRC